MAFFAAPLADRLTVLALVAVFADGALGAAVFLAVLLETPFATAGGLLMVPLALVAALAAAFLGAAFLGEAFGGEAFLGVVFLAYAFLGAALLGDAPLGAALLGEASLGVVFLADAFLGAAFVGAVFPGAACFGAAFFGAAFLVAALVATFFDCCTTTDGDSGPPEPPCFIAAFFGDCFTIFLAGVGAAAAAARAAMRELRRAGAGAACFGALALLGARFRAVFAFALAGCFVPPAPPRSHARRTSSVLTWSELRKLMMCSIATRDDDE